MNGRTRRPLDARTAAEAAFKAITNTPATTTPATKTPGTKSAGTKTLGTKTLGASTLAPAPVPPPRPPVPGIKEQVSLRLDQDVLDHFRAGGPGWQDRINTALRKAAGK
ncbi:BrnA antitoxin family protein [Blastochloris viridis]|uniref:BrnA antitoxin family protein n=1 Tax=Blastochloris viridis TaxID=1079 RepID=A0A0H5B7J1_BLAVI|nr:BrnA antitoxin family protein [Blastochloris viridis]ALK08572.1 hypothetical protein BVIR_778 [Blastochloris viridis]BAR98140.1 hypothetical protein BV133_547 [Blastochloris viridis]CUU41235.1 hypothetical protein BVIRIDIS_02230 [Blastochloris viridis]